MLLMRVLIMKMFISFYGGESENFSQAIEFLSPNKDNKEFVTFLLSDLGRGVMTSNKLSIHVETGDLFY